MQLGEGNKPIMMFLKINQQLNSEKHSNDIELQNRIEDKYYKLSIQ